MSSIVIDTVAETWEDHIFEKKSTERKIYIDFHKSTANMMLSQLFLTQICLFSPALCMFYIFLLYFSSFLLLLLPYFRSLWIDCSSAPIFNHILVSLFSSVGYVRLFVSLFCLFWFNADLPSPEVHWHHRKRTLWIGYFEQEKSVLKEK